MSNAKEVSAILSRKSHHDQKNTATDLLNQRYCPEITKLSSASVVRNPRKNSYTLFAHGLDSNGNGIAIKRELPENYFISPL